MNKLIPLVALLSLTFAACATDPVTHVTAGDIRADHSVLVEGGTVSTGQPDSEVLAAAKAAGFTTVVDMRTEGEDRGMDEVAEVEGLGMSYVAFPIAAPDDVNFEQARALDELLSGTEGPVLLHCGSGNRVGALFALRASLNGASDEEALAIGKEAGMTRLEGVVKERLEEK